jgi:hypothetical protein
LIILPPKTPIISDIGVVFEKKSAAALEVEMFSRIFKNSGRFDALAAK